MAYFNNFPYITYQFPDNVNRLYKNIGIRPAIVDEVFGVRSNFEEYTVGEGETPETIAYDLYGDVNLHWTIMLANNVLNIYTDWPKSTKNLDEYLFEKYKTQMVGDSEVTLSRVATRRLVEFAGSPSNQYEDSDGTYGVIFRPHHFEDADGFFYSNETFGVTKDAFGRSVSLPELFPKSIYAYEEKENEKKRQLLVPKRIVVDQMVSELRKLTNG